MTIKTFKYLITARVYKVYVDFPDQLHIFFFYTRDTDKISLDIPKVECLYNFLSFENTSNFKIQVCCKKNFFPKISTFQNY